MVKKRTRDLDDDKHLLCEDIPIEDRRGWVALIMGKCLIALSPIKG